MLYIEANGVSCHVEALGADRRRRKGLVVVGGDLELGSRASSVKTAAAVHS